jgi:cell pole-organizing protein PopZ
LIGRPNKGGWRSRATRRWIEFAPLAIRGGASAMGGSMAGQEAQAEPSMEEILASIRRIISEEDQPAAAAPVLELNQPADQAAPDNDIVFEEEAPAAPAPAPEPPPVAAAKPEPAPPPPMAEPAPPAPQARVVEIPAPSAPDEPIISPSAASVTASAFTRLAGNLRVADSAGQTLEGMIRQLVRPMLKEWLDENLPAIVEAKVEAELERIARLSR